MRYSGEGLCVVHTDGVECGNCADHCPAEAIRMVPSADGRLYPEVERALCIGCGRCEYVCPASPLSAIHVEGYAVHDDLESGGGERGHGQDTAAVAECRLIGRKQPPMIGQIVGAFVA